MQLPVVEITRRGRRWPTVEISGRRFSFLRFFASARETSSNSSVLRGEFRAPTRRVSPGRSCMSTMKLYYTHVHMHVRTQTTRVVYTRISDKSRAPRLGFIRVSLGSIFVCQSKPYPRISFWISDRRDSWARKENASEERDRGRRRGAGEKRVSR